MWQGLPCCPKGFTFPNSRHAPSCNLGFGPPARDQLRSQPRRGAKPKHDTSACLGSSVSLGPGSGEKQAAGVEQTVGLEPAASGAGGMGTSLFRELRYMATEGSPCANGVRARPLSGCLFDSVVPAINRRVDSVNSSCARGRLPPWRMPAFSAGESDTLVETCLPVFSAERCTEGPLHSAPPTQLQA